MGELSDRRLQQAWAHLSTDYIRNMKPEIGADAARVNAARARIIRLREQEDQPHDR